MFVELMFGDDAFITEEVLSFFFVCWIVRIVFWRVCALCDKLIFGVNAFITEKCFLFCILCWLVYISFVFLKHVASPPFFPLFRLTRLCSLF